MIYNSNQLQTTGEQSLTPKDIVEILDQYIIGQKDAKKAVAVAVRNRWRRLQIPKNLREDVIPANILMIGPTGVGKTEIARRLAKLLNAPFVKDEATRYTEVGYVGKNVTSMIRDLVHTAASMIRAQISNKVEPLARKKAEDRVLSILLPSSKGVQDSSTQTREHLRDMLRKGLLDDREIDIPLSSSHHRPFVEVFSPAGVEEMGLNIQDMISNISPHRKKSKKVRVKDGLELLFQEELNGLVDEHDIRKEACELAANEGIIFIDEIDKIASRRGTTNAKGGPDVSREGVQRDLLPIIEGTTVQTRYGSVNTDHILFIASGAFNMSSPSDMIPELQGRFPIKVRLDDLTQQDFLRILTEPKNSLVLQYQELLKPDKVLIKFDDDALGELAKIAYQLNHSTENIGARRLQTVMSALLEEILFHAPENPGEQVISKVLVQENLRKIMETEDASRYIL
ncbi:MAG: ATP-dependent protease ATPase subunit HslU [bacterium]